IDIDLINDGVFDDLGAVFLGEVDVVHRIVFRLNRADGDAGRVAAALGAALISVDRVPRLRVGDDLDSVLRRRLFEHLVTGGQRDFGHRESRATGRTSVLIVIAGDAELVFRLHIPRLDIVVADRPIFPDTETGLHLEVAGQKTRTGA